MKVLEDGKKIHYTARVRCLGNGTDDSIKGCFSRLEIDENDLWGFRDEYKILHFNVTCPLCNAHTRVDGVPDYLYRFLPQSREAWLAKRTGNTIHDYMNNT